MTGPLVRSRAYAANWNVVDVPKPALSVYGGCASIRFARQEIPAILPQQADSAEFVQTCPQRVGQRWKGGSEVEEEWNIAPSSPL